MKLFKKPLVWLAIGALLLIVGGYMYNNSGNAAGDPVAVTAQVTRVEEKTVSGNTVYCAYGDYTVDGKSYTDVPLAEGAGPYEAGQSLDVEVTPEKGKTSFFDGGLFVVLGVLIVSISFWVYIRPLGKARREAVENEKREQDKQIRAAVSGSGGKKKKKKKR